MESILPYITSSYSMFDYLRPNNANQNAAVPGMTFNQYFKQLEARKAKNFLKKHVNVPYAKKKKTYSRGQSFVVRRPHGVSNPEISEILRDKLRHADFAKYMGEKAAKLRSKTPRDVISLGKLSKKDVLRRAMFNQFLSSLLK